MYCDYITVVLLHNLLSFKNYYTTVTYWNYYITIIKNYCYVSTITIITKPIIHEYYSRTIFKSYVAAWHSKKRVTILLPLLLLLTEAIILLLLKTIAMIQLLLLLLNLLFKNYIWWDVAAWHSKKRVTMPFGTDQLIKEQSFQNRLDW